MYMLPLANRSGGWPGDRGGAGGAAGAGAGAGATAASATPAAGAGADAAHALSAAEPTVCIPLVRPTLLQNLDDYLTLVGDMYYQAPESGKSTAQVSELPHRQSIHALRGSLAGMPASFEPSPQPPFPPRTAVGAAAAHNAGAADVAHPRALGAGQVVAVRDRAF